MQCDRKAFVLAKELLRQRVEIATGLKIKPESPEMLIDALFQLFKTNTKHTIADVVSKHGSAISLLMSMPYALLKDD